MNHDINCACKSGKCVTKLTLYEKYIYITDRNGDETLMYISRKEIIKMIWILITMFFWIEK